MTAPSPDVALGFVDRVLGVKLWTMQTDIVRAVFSPTRNIAVRSCHGAGKTLTAAVCALAWLYEAPGRLVITTAPTARQVNELLWKEIRILHRKARYALGGELPPSAASLFIEDGWRAIGFSSDDPVNVQGWHSAGGTLVIMDEAPGVHPEIWEALHGVLTGARDRILVIGNPTTTSGPFFDAFHPKPGAAGSAWTRLHISAFEVPNVVTGREDFPGLVTREWVEARRAAWGEKSPMWQSRVLGEFPTQADDALVPLSWIDAAVRRWEVLERTGWPDVWAWALGVDVARYGEDSTVAALACAKGVRWIRPARKMDTVETAGWVLATARDIPRCEVRIDADGLGAGVFDNVANTPGVRPVEMRGGMTPLDRTRFQNRRAEWFWTLRERLDPDKPDAIALPPSDDLTAQLTAIKWRLTPKGLLQVESKEDMRARGMKSPDEADAVAYATANVMGEVAPFSLNLDLGRQANPWGRA